MQEREAVIISKARHIFKRRGIRAVTMDDMAREQGISKKTLYLFVGCKDELVHKAISLQVREEQEFCLSVKKKGLNAVDEMFEVGRFMASSLRDVHPSILYDLEKYHPETFRSIKTGHLEFIMACMADNMNRGVNEGLYRKGIDVYTLAKLYIAHVDAVFDAGRFPPGEISFEEIYNIHFEYHIRGIASEEGLKYLELKTTEQRSSR